MSGSAKPRLLERDAELRELRAVFEGVPAGRGRLVVVEGAAGTGKSALTAAASGHGQGAGLRVLRARGSELEREFAFGAVRQLFEPVLAAAADAEREGLLAGAAGPAEWVLAPDPEAPSERATAGFAVLNGIYWLTANLAADQPVLLVVDDAHWADASSLRALSFLAGRIADAPVALLAALRPAEPGAPAQLLDGLRADPSALRIALGPLGAESVARIVRDRLPGADDALCDACHTASAGNPLYLEELLRTVGANGLLSAPDPAAVVREASVPSLGDRVVRRIAGVAPEAPPLATAMAVLGDGGRLSAAATMAGVEPGEAGWVAHRLRLIEVLSTEDPFAFVHPLVRRSVYDGLSASGRDALHTAAGELLRGAGAPAEAVAAHLAIVTPRGSTAVATTLVEAGEVALAQAAPDEATRWFRRALEEEAPAPPRAAVLAELGKTEAMLREPQAISHLEEALELAEDPELRTRTTVVLAEVLFLAGQWMRGRAVTEAARREIRDPQGDLAAELAALDILFKAYASELVDELDRERDDLAEVTTSEGWGARALAAMLAAVAAHRGEGAQKVAGLADQALADGRLLAERTSTPWASAHLLIALVEIDDFERGLQVSHDMDKAARRDGAVTGLITAIDHRGWIHARQGDLIVAETDLRTGLDLATAAAVPIWAASVLFYLQDALLERSTLRDVAEFVETMELDASLAGTWPAAALMAARGRLRLAQLDHERGIADLRASNEIHAALRLGPAVSPSRSALALALPASQREEADALIAEELALARASGLARPQGVALRAAGMLESGDAGIELLRESVSLLAPSGARLEHARSLVELGSALRRLQRRADARPQLETGMVLARRCGAERLAARTLDELRASGGRPRRLAGSGPDALTPSELRVARLAARGATNPEIAQELFVSLKTIETHLSHVYGKLGLSGQGSRGRLAGALDEAPLGAA